MFAAVNSAIVEPPRTFVVMDARRILLVEAAEHQCEFV
jgi:hypothetical protein